MKCPCGAREQTGNVLGVQPAVILLQYRRFSKWKCSLPGGFAILMNEGYVCNLSMSFVMFGTFTQKLSYLNSRLTGVLYLANSSPPGLL